MQARDFVKRFTTVPISFVNELFEMVNESTRQSDIVIDLDKIAKWLSVGKKGLFATLKNSYIENVDYTVHKGVNPNKTSYRANNWNVVLVTPACFKELSMRANTKNNNATLIRHYFIQVEDAFIGYRDQLLKGMETDINTLVRNQRPRIPVGKPGYIYMIRVKNDLTLYKLAANEKMIKMGITGQMQDRLDVYNTGSANNVDVLYQVQTDDMVAVEKCVKLMCKEKQYRKRKEIYIIDIDIMKKVISHCAKARGLITKVPGKKTHTGGYFLYFKPAE